MLSVTLSVLASALIAFAQTPASTASPDSPNPASISGTIKDSTTGKPLAGAQIRLNEPPKHDTVVSDADGHYSFDDVPPGHITLNGEPVPNASVYLVCREYFAGGLRSHFKALASADDQGEYTLRAPPGRTCLVYVESRPMKLDAIARSPDNPKLRREVFTPVFYPNSRDVDRAASVRVQPSGHVEAIDIKMSKSDGYCISGIVANQGVPGEIGFNIGAEQPSFGAGAFGGGLYGMHPYGTTASDGRFRICDLPPGAYRLEANALPRSGNDMAGYGVTNVRISDRDVEGVRLDAMGPQPISGDVVLVGPNPTQPLSDPFHFFLHPLIRAGLEGEQLYGDSSIPGTLTLPAVFPGEYVAFPLRPPHGLHIEDITWAGFSVLHDALHVSGPAALRILLAPGACDIAVNATTDKGDPVTQANLIAIPDGLASEAAIASALVTTTSDQDGNGTLPQLAPGKYNVIATTDTADSTPEFISALLRSRTSKAAELNLTPACSQSQLALKIASLY